MLIEQNIEFELRGPGLPNRNVLLQLANFTTKQKSQRKIFEWIIIYCNNIAGGIVPYFPVSGPNKSLTIKIQQQIARFLTCFELKLQVKFFHACSLPL